MQELLHMGTAQLLEENGKVLYDVDMRGGAQDPNLPDTVGSLRFEQVCHLYRDTQQHWLRLCC